MKSTARKTESALKSLVQRNDDFYTTGVFIECSEMALKSRSKRELNLTFIKDSLVEALAFVWTWKLCALRSVLGMIFFRQFFQIFQYCEFIMQILILDSCRMWVIKITCKNCPQIFSRYCFTVNINNATVKFIHSHLCSVYMRSRCSIKLYKHACDNLWCYRLSETAEVSIYDNGKYEYRRDLFIA